MLNSFVTLSYCTLTILLFSLFLAEFKSRITGDGYWGKWDQLFRYAAQSKKTFYVLVYEDLLQDPVNEIRKVMKFLHKTNGFKQENLEERLLCVSQNLEVGYKRKKSVNDIDPYTNELKAKLNSVIDSAQSVLTRKGLSVNITGYKRNFIDDV